MEKPSFLKTAGEFISPDKAKQMIDKFMKSARKGKIDSVLFSREKIEELLAQPDCAGVRIYFAASEDIADAETVVLKAVNKEGLVIENKILEVGSPCPPYC